jgi:hypothetical protein
MRTEIFSHSRHPFQVFILSLCVISGVPIVIGLKPPPGSLQEFVPPLILEVWGFCLVIGALMGLIGAAWRDRGNGLIVEQLGLTLVGLACCFYAVILGYYTLDRGGLFSAAITLGFGLSCLVRAWQIQQYLKRVHRVVLQVKLKRGHDPKDIHDIGEGV